MRIRDNFGDLVEKRQVKRLKVEYQYTWIIPNYLHCVSIYQHYDESSIFLIGENSEFKWKLNIYLGGYNKPDYIAIRPVLIQEDSHGNKKFTVEMSLLDKEGQERYCQSKILQMPNSDTNFGIFPSFIMKQDLLNNPNLLPEGELRILCQISFDVSITAEELIESQYSRYYQKSQLDNFEQLFGNDKFSDFKLIIGKNEFLVHQAILAARSPVFEAMFLSNMRESKEKKAPIEDIDPDIMMQVLRYIYAGKIGKIQDTADKVLIVADKYQLDALKQICEDILVEQLSIDNIYKILELADNYNGENFKRRALDFFKKNFEKLSAIDDFRATISSLPGNLQTDIICALAGKMLFITNN